MIELKTPGEIDAIAAAGAIVAEILDAVRAHARPGIRCRELDDLALTLIAHAGATPSFLGYHPRFAPVPYPAVLCVSVNETIVHGVPDEHRLGDGDLLSLDLAIHLDGWCADSATSGVIGHADPSDLALIETTTQALEVGTDACLPGGRMGDIGRAITCVARPKGYGLMADHGGHGVGRSMHEAPHVPNEGRPGHGLRLRRGLVLALEPMLTAGGRDAYRAAPDGWSMRTADGSRQRTPSTPSPSRKKAHGF
jgi:methionyl aminopeptidase